MFFITRFKPLTCFSVWFSKAVPKGEYANLADSTICLRLEDSISWPVRYSYLSIFPDGSTDIFAASLLISYSSFSSLILLSIVMISLYCFWKIFSKKLHCVKTIRIRSYSGLHFPGFGMNTERYRVFLPIQSYFKKTGTRITPNTDTFHAVLSNARVALITKKEYGFAVHSL